MTLSSSVNTPKTAPRLFTLASGEVRNCLISFAKVLDSGELVDNAVTPTVTAALHDEDQDEPRYLEDDHDDYQSTSTDTTFTSGEITNEATNTASETITEEGETVAIDQGVTFTLDAANATVGAIHRISIACDTDSTNVQTLKGYVLVKVVDR